MKTKASVLVVEDHADTLRFLLRLLALSGYTAHGASSVAEAVRVASRQACEIIIADLTLPDGSGLELLPALRRHFDDVKGIVLTGHDGAGMEAAARAAGYDAHLVKPVTFQNLLSTLEAVRCAKRDGASPQGG
jgi:DNA-binding response OmpR family regulator